MTEIPILRAVPDPPDQIEYEVILRELNTAKAVMFTLEGLDALLDVEMKVGNAGGKTLLHELEHQKMVEPAVSGSLPRRLDAARKRVAVASSRLDDFNVKVNVFAQLTGAEETAQS